jgi:hypothetical protein
MMHEEKLYTSYFEGILRCNRISNAHSGFKAIITVVVLYTAEQQQFYSKHNTLLKAHVKNLMRYNYQN